MSYLRGLEVILEGGGVRGCGKGGRGEGEIEENCDVKFNNPIEILCKNQKLLASILRIKILCHNN